MEPTVSTPATPRLDRRHNPLRNLYEFEAWLKTKRRGDTVGEPGKPESCPLARYIAEQRGAAFVRLPDMVGFVVDNQYFHLPDWAAEFVMKVDARRNPITAGDAIHILEIMALAEGV